MNTVMSRPKFLSFRIYEKYKKIVVVFILIVLLFVFGATTLPNFLSVEQVFMTIKLASFTALFALCQMIVIAGGGSGLDLSVGYTATITAVLTASIMDGKNEPLLLAVLIALALGVMIGLANGVLTSYLKLPPLVVTLAMADILQGIVNAYVAGKAITGRPSPILVTIAAKFTGKFPNILFVLILVTSITMIILNKTKWGQILFGVGANERTAYLSGINVKKVRCITFTVSGVLSSLMGLLLLGNMGIAFKDMGSNYVLPSIAAVVIGGVSLAGGGGKLSWGYSGSHFPPNADQPAHRLWFRRCRKVVGVWNHSLRHAQRLRQQPPEPIVHRKPFSAKEFNG